MLFIINVSLCGLILKRLYLLFKLKHFENERESFYQIYWDKWCNLGLFWA